MPEGLGDGDGRVALTLLETDLPESAEAAALRELADRGGRADLARWLSARRIDSLARADACLEAQWPSDDLPSWDAVLAAPAQLPDALQEAWRALLDAELVLHCGGDPRAVEKRLAAIVTCHDALPPDVLATFDAPRIAGRAVAAIVRARIAQGRDDGGLLVRFEDRLPSWERAYLGGLSQWAVGNGNAAEGQLQKALHTNPNQTCVRSALASLLGERSPADALDLIAAASAPTREAICLQAVLHARRRQYDEAAAVLARLPMAAGVEAPRYSWASGRRQLRSQERHLQIALLEWRGDFKGAARALRGDRAAGATAGRARELFALTSALDALPADRGWERDVAVREVESAERRLGTGPLAGDELFFRALSLVRRHPDRARKDLLTLVRQRAWIAAEVRAGGWRIVAAADALARLDRPAEAVAVYERLGDRMTDHVREHCAMAVVYAALLQRTAGDDHAAARHRADALAPGSAWLAAIDALGAVMRGENDQAAAHLARAAERGAPASVLRILSSLANGAPIADADLAELRLSERAKASVRLGSGGGVDAARIEAFVASHGADWVAACPGDVEHWGRLLIAALCDDGRWEEAHARAIELARAGRSPELAPLVRIRHALARIVQGHVGDAARLLDDAARTR